MDPLYVMFCFVLFCFVLLFQVISNVMHGCSPLLLSGMQEVGVTDGVRVWRPLLQFPKKDIFDFAHKYGVSLLRKYYEASL